MKHYLELHTAVRWKNEAYARSQVRARGPALVRDFGERGIYIMVGIWDGRRRWKRDIMDVGRQVCTRERGMGR